MEDYVVQVHEQ